MTSTNPEDQHYLMQVEEQWPVIQDGIDKLIKLIEGDDDKTQSFSSQDYMDYYTAVYNLCKPNPTGGACEVLYDKYSNVFKDYISSKVLPSLQEKKDEEFMKEIEKRWSDHKVMTRWLSRFFYYLDRYFVPKRKLPTLQESAVLSFYDLVFGEFNNQIKDAVLSLIDREREGEDIDQALIKNIVGIYVDVGEGSTKYYERDFEETMFKATASFYYNKACNWIKNESYKDYMVKVECCLKHERDTVSCYLQYASRKKLLQIVEHELISVYETELKEKKEIDESPLTEESI